MGAKIVLYDDGTAAVSVFLIGADGKQEFLTYEGAVDRKAAEAIVHARAAAHGIEAGHIEILYEDRRSASRIRSRPLPGKAH
jgi:hypothetical protein